MTILTQDGYDAYAKELKDLQLRRPQAVAELARASELGDRSENAAYRVAKSELRHLDGRIRFLQKLFHRVQIARPSSTDTAHIGNTVTLTQDTHTYRYRLVDSIQSDLSTGDLSIHSPLGRALVGKKAGDVITYHTPRGEKCTTIVTIY